ncbi:MULTISPECIES: ferrochelatase [unclassified Salinivibrio]|uniref:ferrochelatase n=1 Tax=unclassified Salinivibrio TaxID=2636825 RepID=UPI0009853CF6|nr:MULTISPECIES: ferrochelatase [unclassified Salinivibrio]OOF16088.1 ferrochelatase [Salinivibrio sp. PR919]OOF16823.1 ferrochelatase [Salinivibrio sp. PR932]
MTEKHNQVGVLLVNLGTPEAPTSQSVKAFLSEFLHDHRVVDLTRWLWCPLLHGVILPIRSPKVAKLYQSIWMEEGSPLMVYAKRQQKALAEQVSVPVALGMTYGNPSIAQGLDELQAKGCDKVLVLPLYPQYSATTTAAVFDKVAKSLKGRPVIPALRYVNHYHDHPLYQAALAHSVKQHWQVHGKGDLLLCSYHGIPQRFADNGDPYPRHCEQTTSLLQAELGLADNEIMMTYQSRFGREEWLKPYTDKTLETLPSKGVKTLDIMTPAFSADCLETLEEIAEQCRDTFLEAGGERFRFIPCLNDDEAHIHLMASLVAQHTQGW